MLAKKFDKETPIRDDEDLVDQDVESGEELNAASSDDHDHEDSEDDEVVLIDGGPHFPLSAGGATPLDLAKLGVSQFAYIRRALVNDIPMWTIHSASGDPLGAAHSFDQAWAAVKQNDLVPLRVH